MCAFFYSDDKLLIAPNHQAMELMLQEVDKLALKTNIHFSTDPDPAKSKSKVIYVNGRQAGLAKRAFLLLSSLLLPWVSTATHLGNESCEMHHNITVKLAILIGKSVEVRDSFSLEAPSSILRALQVYCS